MSHVPDWQRGLALALTTAIFWGLLPIALTVVLTGTDAFTLTALRFLTAAVILGLILARNRTLPDLATLRGPALALILIALAGLVANFILFLVGLKLTSPTITQVVIQLSPMLLLLGGVIVFGERLTARRWLGFALLIVGMMIFFNRRLPELVHPQGQLGLGVLVIALGSFVWACYGLAQKQLLRTMGSQQILLLLYAGAAIVLLPFSALADVGRFSLLQWGMLAFCCINTVIAYGALAEAMKAWDVSRVSAVITITPLFTMLSVWLFRSAWPGIIHPEQLNALSIAGAVVVVLGSALTALGGVQRTAEAKSVVEAPEQRSGNQRCV
jgi:drug/metabolite transporter (DMT)-like permease